MHESFLIPPNASSLSDAVICRTVQRVSRSSISQDIKTSEGNSLNNIPPAKLKRSKGMADELAIHRQRRRVYQQRYRKKLCGRATQSERDIEQFREEIRKLEQHRLVLLSGLPTTLTPWQVVSEYFSLFRYGLKPFVETQREFLQKTMAPNLFTKSGNGVEALLADWEELRVCHGDLEIKLERLEYDEPGVLLAMTTGSSTITEKTLYNAFPHLLQEENWSPIARKLLGQRLVVSSVGRFEWDSEMQKVVSVHYSSDLVTPLLKMLGNLEDVAFVLQNALIIHQ